MLKQAVQKDEVLLADIAASHNDGNDFGVWWLGQSGFLVKWQGHQLLLDPYLSDSLTKKYAETDKPHVRLSERVLDPGLLQGIEVVTSSHNHTDHLDADTLLPLAKANPGVKLVLPVANIGFASDRLGEGALEMIGLDEGSEEDVGPFHFVGVAAAHNEIDRDEEGRCRYLGFLVRFGPWTLFHSGDTLWHDALVAKVLPHAPDLMLLPINGNKPERRVAGNFNATEAAAFGRACNGKVVIPCHYDMFAFNTADPADFLVACDRLGQTGMVLGGGDRWSSGLA